MSSRHGSTTLTSPSLIPLFGGTDRKARPLDREVVTLGRARGSDFCLDANEVSALHCVIYRSSDGFRVRDCGSRTGTRVNGNAIKNAVLNNGDVLNIGPFSFEMRVPADYESNNSSISPVVVDKLRRSRQKLARRALKMRQRLQIALSLSAKGKTSDSHHGLLGKVKKQEDRMREMEDAELELIEERENLEKEKESLRKRIQQVERDIEDRLRQADEKIKAEWDAFQHRVKEQENQLEQRQRTSTQTMIGDAPLDESQMLQLGDAKAAFELERETFAQERQLFEAEIADAKAHLDRQKQTIAKAEESVRTQRDQIAKMIGDLKKMQEEVRKTQKGDTAALDAEVKQLKQALAAAEAKLAAPRVDPAVAKENERLTRMVDELEQRLRNAAGNEDIQARLEETIQENDRLRIIAIELEQQVVAAQHAQAPAADAELEKKVSQLENENELLHHIINELKSSPAQAATASIGDAELRDENELLRKLLAEKDKLVDEMTHHRHGGESLESHASGAEVDQLARENDTLREMLRQREQEIAQLQIDATPKDENDLASYEAELNRFRQQLEKDRAKLGEEFETLRVRNEEMDETIREMEMQMSRERAEMARERQRLDRMREEIKLEMERMQRDTGVRESLATVQKLREEINGSRPPSVAARPGTQPPAAAPARNLNDRLSNLRPGR
jgi:pSer/pThr/pTyr-binding forkhead associated (FHA) protein